MSMQVTPINSMGNGYSQPEPNQERISMQTATVDLQSSQESLSQKRKEPVKEPNTEIMADLERLSVAFNKRLKFVMNYQSHDITVKVIDPETDKVIKELPPAELQRLHAHLKEAIGVLFDETI